MQPIQRCRRLPAALLHHSGPHADPSLPPPCRTGPHLLRDALVKWGVPIEEDGSFSHTEVSVGSYSVRLYPVGRWLTPCFANDKQCRVDTQTLRAVGRLDLAEVRAHRGGRAARHAQDELLV